MNASILKDKPLAVFFIGVVISAMLPFGLKDASAVHWWEQGAVMTLLLGSCLFAGVSLASANLQRIGAAIATLGVILGGMAVLFAIQSDVDNGFGALGIWVYVIGLGFFAWRAMELTSKYADDSRAIKLAVPIMFGAWVLFLWQIMTTGFEIPSVLLPSPELIWFAIIGNTDTLAADFYQTFVKSVLSGFLFGCGSGFIVAILVDKVPFLQRGLLPLGSMVSAIPIVGIAPIMVMWFGFDWESKAAVIVVMTFFPMLVNTLAGLEATSHLEKDLMRSYAASYFQTLFFVRLPNALPFLFNALKINSTLALIGAIVAEFFGTPIVGMGFRISTEVGRMNVDIVWATIAVAAVAGSLSYGLLALLERSLTFWHPSYRSSGK